MLYGYQTMCLNQRIQQIDPYITALVPHSHAKYQCLCESMMEPANEQARAIESNMWSERKRGESTATYIYSVWTTVTLCNI